MGLAAPTTCCRSQNPTYMFNIVCSRRFVFPRHVLCTLYCRSMASFGSSLILGLFFMFFALLAYLKEIFTWRQRGDRAAVKTAAAVDRRVGNCLPTTGTTLDGCYMKQEAMCAPVSGHVGEQKKSRNIIYLARLGSAQNSRSPASWKKTGWNGSIFSPEGGQRLLVVVVSRRNGRHHQRFSIAAKATGREIVEAVRAAVQ